MFNTGGGFNDIVNAIALQTNNNIIVGGDFTTYSGGTIIANSIIKLNSDGSADNTFISKSGFTGFIYSMVLQNDNKIIIGGQFTEYSGQSANNIIRLNSDGTIDTNFTTGSGFNGTVCAVALQSDGKILVGGGFNSYSGITANFVTRLNSDGSKDDVFDTSDKIKNSVNTIVLQPDEKIFLGGNFYKDCGGAANRIIRLNSDSSIDNTFNSGNGFNGYVYTIKLLSDCKILVGGSFSVYSGQSIHNIIKLNSNGNIDNTFVSGDGFDGSVCTIALQSNGKILAGGNFTTYSGQTANYITRLNTNGTIDSTFITGHGFNDNVNNITLQPNGKIIVGGDFGIYSGQTANYITRLNSNGINDIYPDVTPVTTIDLSLLEYRLYERTNIGDGATESAFDAAFAAIDHEIYIEVTYMPEEIVQGNIK